MSNHPNRGKIVKGVVVRVKRRADRDTATVVADVAGDERLVRVDPPLFGHSLYPRDMLIRASTEDRPYRWNERTGKPLSPA